MKNSKPLVIAHRGNTEKHLENTLPAFEAALESKVDGVELDLQLTQDGTIIIFHDRNLKRLAGIFKNIEQMTYSELKKIKLQKKYTIPTLDDFLDLVGNKMLINLELKSHGYLGGLKGSLEMTLAKKLKAYKYPHNLILSSFNPLSLIRMKFLCPEIRRGYLFEDKYYLHYHLFLRVPQCYSIHSPLDEMSPEKVSDAHKSGKKFFVWTVNDENDMRACLEAGVDGIITDQPTKLQQLLQKL